MIKQYQKKNRKLTKSDSDSSTDFSDDDISSDKENMKLPIVATRNKCSLLSVNEYAKDTIHVSPTPGKKILEFNSELKSSKSDSLL